jgi:endonuclease/exonuclease/phosphatase family metal-dependent hydrolase
LLSSINRKYVFVIKLLLLFSFHFNFSFGQDTVKVVTYNLLRYNGDTDRNNYFNKVIDELSADIYIAQELSNSSGVSNFLNNILNFGGGDKYLSAKFYDDHDIDQALFFNKEKFEIISTSKIIGDPRDIMVYRLKHIGTDKLFFIFNMHLKASQGSSNQIRRETQVSSLIDYTKQMSNDHFYIAAGDFNIYTTNEPAYRKFFEETSTGIGKFNDLITVEGKYNEAEFSSVHTQSPRTSQFGGGASGGLDDRFDYILFSDSLVSSDRTFVIENSYNVLGNDGNHYNMAINEMPNSSVSQDIADALHYASDHLPVSVNIVFSNDVVSVNQPPVVNDTIFSVNEFPQDKTQIGKISAYDPENESLSYSIISGNNQNIFSIDYEGNIVVENGSLLDYEIKNSYLLVIQVSDGELKKNLQLTINVIDSPPLLLEDENKKSIHLKPNPVEEILYVTLDNSNFKNYFIRSINGNVLLSDDIIKNQFEINLRYIPDGTYIFEAISDNNKSFIKVIKKGS